MGIKKVFLFILLGSLIAFNSSWGTDGKKKSDNSVNITGEPQFPPGTLDNLDIVYSEIVSFGEGYFKQPKVNSFFITPGAQESQNWPQVATDGEDYLVIWTQKAYQTHLYAARVTSQGKVLDPCGFLISKGGFHRFPRVAFGKDPKTGKGYYLVVWQRMEDNLRHSVHGVLVSSPSDILVNMAEVVLDKTSPYGFSIKETILKGKAAVNSDGIYIFPDIKGHTNPYQELDPLAGYAAPDVSFNGKDFVVSSGGNVRLIEPGTGKVSREKQKNVVYPLGKPITVKISNCVYSSRIQCSNNSECLLACVSSCTKPALTDLQATKIKFNGFNYNVSATQVVSDTAEAPYGDFELATNGSGTYWLAWHDRKLTNIKKVKPSDPYTPDLFTARIKSIPGNPLAFKVNIPVVLYMKKNFTDYYPKITYDGNNFVIIWKSGGTSLKTQWMKDNGATWLTPENWPQQEFWDFISNKAKKEAMSKLNCMADYGVLGTYVAENGAIVESFGIIGPDKGKDHYGLINFLGDIRFGKYGGLIVYRWINTDAWDKQHPQYLIKGRLISKSLKVVKFNLNNSPFFKKK